MNQFASLLYNDSPFLPAITAASITQIRQDLHVSKLPPIVAIAKEVGLVGASQNQIHQDELAWISETFHITVVELDNFFIGFTTPPTLIMGGHLLQTRSTINAIKAYILPTSDPDLIKLNEYKARYLFTAFHILNSTKERSPGVGMDHIYHLCRTEPYKNDFYYLAGVEASYMLFSNFIKHLYPL